MLLQFQRFIDATARSLFFVALRAVAPIRAQKESLRAPPCGCGAFKFEPVAAFSLALPRAVKPAPRDVGNFSPLEIAKLGVFRLMWPPVNPSMLARYANDTRTPNSCRKFVR